jgi:hypothetical protein
MQSIEDGLNFPGEKRGDTTIYFNGIVPLREPGFTFADDEGRAIGAFVTLVHEQNQTPIQSDIFGDWRVFIQQTRDGKRHRKVTKYHWFKTKQEAIDYINQYFKLAVSRAKKNFRKIPW